MSSRLSAFVATLVLGASLSAARAAEPGPPAAAPDPVAACRSRDLSQIDLNACADAAFKAQDRALNAVYAQLAKQEDAGGRKQLQAAQRAWLQFRDLECVYEAPDTGGSIAPLEKATCLATLTAERVLDLRRVLADKPT